MPLQRQRRARGKPESGARERPGKPSEAEFCLLTMASAEKLKCYLKCCSQSAGKSAGNNKGPAPCTKNWYLIFNPTCSPRGKRSSLARSLLLLVSEQFAAFHTHIYICTEEPESTSHKGSSGKKTKQSATKNIHEKFAPKLFRVAEFPVSLRTSLVFFSQRFHFHLTGPGRRVAKNK